MMYSNFLKEIRENRLISKAELSRRAGISTHTIDRVEKGMPCRISTKRKIILALGFEISEKDKVFPSE
jgi:DNA-binding XRE family transcriptional regulator